MTELQTVELELLRQFLAVCEREGLTYYMVCGSALGAVKYGGFIPWDDDIDVALPRADYERFCRVAPGLLPVFPAELPKRAAVLPARKQAAGLPDDLRGSHGGAAGHPPRRLH